LWLTATFDGLLAIDGTLDPEAGQLLLAALDPLTRPHSAQDTRSGSQRRADALTELARRALEGGQLPRSGGVRPQLAVLVDLDSLQSHPGTAAVGGEVGWAGPLGPEACRRLARDGAVTRVLVTRQPTDHRHPSQAPAGNEVTAGSRGPGPMGGEDLATRLRTAAALLPRFWVGRPVSRWTWAGPPGSSPRPNGPPWPSATAAVCFLSVTGRWPGVRVITWGTGWTAAPPTWRIWSCCAGLTIGPSMTAAGG
jgi:uncharacterized protein DUF222